MAGWNYNEAAFHSVVDGEVAALTEKTTPVDADLILIEDSEDDHAKKKVQISNLGGGASELDDLTDVDLSTPPTDGQVLKFDNSSSSWLAADDEIGSGSLPTPSAKGDIAVYDGDSWEILTVGTNDHVLTADSAQSLGVKWAAASGGASAVVVRKASAQSVTSSTTLVNDDDLTFPVDANDIWVVNYYLYVDGATGGDIKATVVGPSGSAGRSSLIGTGTSGTTFENTNFNNQSNPLGTAPPAGTLGVGNVNVVHVAASVVVGETSGSIVLQWAQQASSGTATRVLDGSYLVAHKVS